MPQSQKTLEFLQKLKDKGHWNDDYDYTKVIYINAKTSVILFNKLTETHHNVNPFTLLHRNSKCVIQNAIDKTDFFIKSSKLIHGDIYDYSLTKYVSGNKVKIVCTKHGVFEQAPSKHLNGSGCNSCGNESIGNKLRTTVEEVIQKFKIIHRDKYDYSLVNYSNSKENISIICKIHGVFEQSPESHLSGSGCPTCAGKKITMKDTLEAFREIHGDKYDYQLVEYKNTTKPIKIICPTHGIFTQKPIAHKRGGGCPKCSNNIQFTTEQIIQQFIKIHSSKYDYSQVNYINSKTKLKIICPEHGIFMQSASVHKRPAGCPTCGIGWNTKRVINFVNDIRNEDILNMDPVELNMLIAQGKLPKEFEELVFTLEGTKENSLKTLKEKLGIEEEEELSEERTEEVSDKLEVLTSTYDDELNDAISAIETPSIEEVEYSETEQKKRQGLPNISNEDILVLDKELIGTCDDEAVEFFIQYKLKKVWNEVINDKREVDEIKLLNGGKNSSRLRDLFLEEYNRVVNYNPPKGYAFQHQPNMMQKLTVQRVKDYKRYGNWSGTGAGKTISFIIASREIKSKLTVVICLNSTVSQLEEDILDVYPDSLVHSNFKKGKKFDRSKYNYGR